MPLIDFDIMTLEDTQFNLITHVSLKRQDDFPMFSRWIVQVARNRLNGFCPPIETETFNKRCLDNASEFCRYWGDQFFIMAGETPIAEESDRYVLLQDFLRAVLMTLVDETQLREDREKAAEKAKRGIEPGDAEWVNEIDVEGTNCVQG